MAPVPRNEKPVSTRLFREAMAERDYAYTKVERELGQSIQAPNLFREGIRRAKALTT